MIPPPAGVLTRAESRQVDEIADTAYGLSGLVLMENAGRGCADVLCRLGVQGPIVICCGRGNNAGDGFVLARHLDIRGYAVKLLLWCDPDGLRGDAKANFGIVAKSGIPIELCGTELQVPELTGRLGKAEWLVDALLGTGTNGAPRPPMDRAIQAMNAFSCHKLAIDLPSGLDCDTGIPADPTFRADHTCTFVAPKIGFSTETAKRCLGEVHVVDIGVPRRLLRDMLGHRSGSPGSAPHA